MRRSKWAIKKYKMQFREEKSTRKFKVTKNAWNERVAVILKDLSTERSALESLDVLWDQNSTR